MHQYNHLRLTPISQNIHLMDKFQNPKITYAPKNAPILEIHLAPTKIQPIHSMQLNITLTLNLIPIRPSNHYPTINIYIALYLFMVQLFLMHLRYTILNHQNFYSFIFSYGRIFIYSIVLIPFIQHLNSLILNVLPNSSSFNFLINLLTFNFTLFKLILNYLCQI